MELLKLQQSPSCREAIRLLRLVKLPAESA
jgi:hypothetical protein